MKRFRVLVLALALSACAQQRPYYGNAGAPPTVVPPPPSLEDAKPPAKPARD
jgi:hypothetical protein